MSGTQAIEPGARWTSLSVTVVALCFLLNGIDGANVFAVSYLAPIVARDWNLSSGVLGVVFSSLLAGMGVGGLFLAPLADRFGRRRMVLVSLALMAAGMILTSVSSGVVGFAIARGIVGLGIGTVLACMTALVYEFSPASSRSAAVGLLQAGYPIAAAASGFATAWAVQHYSWRAVMLFQACARWRFFRWCLRCCRSRSAFCCMRSHAGRWAESTRLEGDWAQNRWPRCLSASWKGAGAPTFQSC